MRTAQQIKQHYVVEKELADRLRNASRDERAELYGKLYDELFRRVPEHPQLTRKHVAAERECAINSRLPLLLRFLTPATVFLEIGAGDGSLCRYVAPRVKRALALDVSREILDQSLAPNMQFVLSGGCDVPVPEGSVTLAYSYQVMEHIHPADATEQLRNIHRALAADGMYLCVTPNRLNGPHDISQFFDDVATGFHLHEYTYSELAALFRSSGFRQIRPYIGFRKMYFTVPLWTLTFFEACWEKLPARLGRRLGRIRGFENVLFISLLGIK
jgi:SAM-dependent methyltransferase